MDIIIKKASIDDLEIVRDFTKKLISNSFDKYDPTININFADTDGGKNYLEKSINNDDRIVLLAESDGKIVGYILAMIEKVGDFRIIDNQCEIDFLWVEEEYRVQGIATKLLKSVDEWCIEKGIKRVIVSVDPKNAKAIELYKELAFSECDLHLGKNL